MIRCGIYDYFFRPNDPSITWRQPCPPFWQWVDQVDDPARVDVVMATWGSGHRIADSKHPRRVLYLQETKEARPHPSLDGMKAFDLVLSNDLELVDSLPNAEWTSLFGVRMKPEHYLFVPEKTRNVSLMGSGLRGPSPGHVLRHEVHHAIRGKDSYGFDGNTYNKVDSLGAYRYQVAIESARYPDWITEKMWDCLALRTMPIYWGGITPERFATLGFNPAGVIWWDGNLTALQDMVDFMNRDDSLYRAADVAIDANRRRVLEIPSGEYMLATVLGMHYSEIAAARYTP